MRAQLRTYHAIPSLQAHQDPNSYKQLQDAPRLKSILKGASEDRVEPNTLDKIKNEEVPRTNPVNLIFVLATYAPKVTELHFPLNHDFYDLIMRTNLSSASRATAFLWLMWFYLESDFTEEGADENPFGPGVDYDLDVRNQGVPRFEVLSKEEEEAENFDSPEEVNYGYDKMYERKRIIEADQAAFQAEHGPPKRGPKPKLHLPPADPEADEPMLQFIKRAEIEKWSTPKMIARMRPKYESDMDSTRSTPPPRALPPSIRLQGVTGRSRGSLKPQLADGSSPVHGSETVVRRSRPLTAHQLAVERNRNQRVDYILSRGLRKSHHRARKLRRQEGAFFRAMQRTRKMLDEFEDSEGEENLARDPSIFKTRGFGGLVQLDAEDDDFGEEMSAYAAAFRRMGRRLDRWDSQKDLNLGVMGTNRVLQSPVSPNGHAAGRDNDETEDERPSRPQKKQNPKANVNVEDEEDLDDMEKEILGLGSDNEEEEDGDGEGEEDLDDVDKALLGIGGDETEDDLSGMDVD